GELRVQMKDKHNGRGQTNPSPSSFSADGAISVNRRSRFGWRNSRTSDQCSSSTCTIAEITKTRLQLDSSDGHAVRRRLVLIRGVLRRRI
ncbi:hypothetical protein LSAT2_029975, partial [Lamellibrachia satsuma]